VRDKVKYFFIHPSPSFPLPSVANLQLNHIVAYMQPVVKMQHNLFWI
jgi:hypothetical protein